jgi:hypothetical protein
LFALIYNLIQSLIGIEKKERERERERVIVLLKVGKELIMAVQHANSTNQSTLLHAISVTATAMLMMTFFHYIFEFNQQIIHHILFGRLG